MHLITDRSYVFKLTFLQVTQINADFDLTLTVKIIVICGK